MTRLLTGFSALVLLTGVGCLHIQPVGVMAKTLGTSPSPTRPAPGVTVVPAREVSQGPVVQPAPAPAPPALLVTPGEVTGANHQEKVRRLMEEMEADRRAMEAIPRPSEVSVIKR